MVLKITLLQLFPEMWSDGYAIPQNETVIDDLLIAVSSDFIQGFSRQV